MTHSEFIPINDGLLSPQIIRLRKYDDRLLVEVYTKSYEFKVRDAELAHCLREIEEKKT